jgi:hypothetical protein
MAGPVVGRHRTRSRVGSGAARDRNLHAGQSADCPDLNGRLSPIAGQGVAAGPQSPHGEALPHRLLGGAVASETTLRPVAPPALAGAGNHRYRDRRSCHRGPAGAAQPDGRRSPAQPDVSRPAGNRGSRHRVEVRRIHHRRRDVARQIRRGAAPVEVRRIHHRRRDVARQIRRGVLRRPPAGGRRNGGSRSAGRRIARLPATVGHHLAHLAHLAQPVRPSLVAQAHPARYDEALQIAPHRDVAACRPDRAVRNDRPLACVDGQASLDPFILFGRHSGGPGV